MAKVKNKDAKSTFNMKALLGIVLFIVVFGVLLGLATVYDLQVSKTLADLSFGKYFTTNPFGVLGECIGSWPAYAFLAVAFAIIYTNTKRSENKALKVLGSIAANIASVVAMYVLVTDTVGYMKQHFNIEKFTGSVFATIIFVCLAAALGELACFAFSKVSDEQAKALLKFAFIIIFTVALSNIIVNIIKNIMYRPRFRTMKYFCDSTFSQYHRWYEKGETPVITDEILKILPKHPKDAYRSFPSGHTCAAGTTYCIIALPYLFNKYNTKLNRFLMYFFGVLVTGLVAVSRIVCGAHFFSDVLIGGTITFLCAMLAIKIFIKKDFKRV